MFTISHNSTAAFYPLSANYSFDTKLNFKPAIRYFSNGYTSISNPILNSMKDVKSGRDTTFFVSSANNLMDVVADTSRTIGVFDLAVYSGLLAGNGFLISRSGSTLYASGTALDSNSFFQLQTNDDGTISIIYNQDQYFTVSRSAPYNITLQDEIINDQYNQQRFHYYTVGNQIYFITFVTSNECNNQVVQRYFSYSAVNNQLRAIGIIGDDDYNYTNNYHFTLSGLYLSSLSTGFNAKVHWVDYYNEQEDIGNNKNVVIRNSVEGVKQNFLISTPYKTKVQSNSAIRIGSYDINMATLKNVQTPEYEYAIAPFISGNDAIILPGGNYNRKAVKRREYEKMFIGSNQDEGYDKPFLGYTSDTKQVTFDADKVTYFHYPTVAPRIALSAAGLIESGAIAGRSPNRADKVWKKMANYKKNIWWGNSKQWQDGTYLCSWLSGAENGITDARPVWKDRWYNPGYTTYQAAISTIEITFNSAVGSWIYDEDSTMTFDPGVYYKYYHKGNLGNLSIVRSLTGDGTHLKLHFDEWSQTVDDKSPYGNDGTLQGYTTGMIAGKGVTFDGTNQSCFVPYNSSYNTEDDVSFSVWVKASNWDNIEGNHIVDNNFRGGWTLEYDNGFHNPIFPVMETTYGHILLMANGRVYKDVGLPANGRPVAVLTDPDLYTWTLDDNNKRLYKIDYNGDIVKQINFNTTVNFASSLGFDGTETLYLMDKVAGSVSGINIFTNEVNYVDPAPDPLRNAFGMNAKPYKLLDAYNWVGAPWQFKFSQSYNGSSQRTYIISPNNGVYHNPTSFPILTGGTNYKHMGIDKDDYIWALHDQTLFTKISTDSSSYGTFILSGSIGTSTSDAPRSISFSNEWNGSEWVDYVWIIQSADSKIYKLDTNGNQVGSYKLTDGIDLSKYLSQDQATMNFVAYGDPTGYESQRLYNYHWNNKTKAQIKSKITLGNSYLSAEKTVQYPTSALTNNEWHHFAGIYDQTNGAYNLYVDSVLRDTVSAIPGSKVYYEYENPLYIGANIGRFGILDGEINSNQYYFKGSVDDLRIYDWVLNNSDIAHIYALNHNYNDLYWNMPTGTQNYLEEIERFFMHKMPGAKSQFYNIRLIGLGITDTHTRKIIENTIRDTVKKVSPAYAELFRIIWE